MARLTMRVEDNVLVGIPNKQDTVDFRPATTGYQATKKDDASLDAAIPHEYRDIEVGSPDWFHWLAMAESFSFSSAAGTFTARKEHAQRGSAYWRAYRMQHGVLRRAYLGKSERLTPEHLNQVARDLAYTDRAQPVRKLVPDRGTQQQDLASRGARIAAKRQAASQHLDPEAVELAWPRRHPLMTSKWSVPALPATFVSRTRLTALVQLCNPNNCGHRDNDCVDRSAADRPHIFLVTAPAGFGKTTLLRCWSREWAQAPSRAVAWVSLDSGDNESALFWRYLATAIDQACPGAGAAALAYLDSSGDGSLTPVVAALVNGLATTPVSLFLVLDDYHVPSRLRPYTRH